MDLNLIRHSDNHVSSFRNNPINLNLFNQNNVNYDEDMDVSFSFNSNITSLLNRSDIPSPYNNIVDVNIQRQSIIYEVELNRDHGIEFAQGNNVAIVGKIDPNSPASLLGIEVGDIVTSTSATAGDAMWTHDSPESVQSALSTRLVLSSSVRARFERPINKIPPVLRDTRRVLVPYTSVVRLKRPLGIRVTEHKAFGPGDPRTSHVYIDCVRSDYNKVKVLDQILAMSPMWGGAGEANMWDVKTLDDFMRQLRMNTQQTLSLRIKRFVPLDEFTNKIEIDAARALQRSTSSSGAYCNTDMPDNVHPVPTVQVDPMRTVLPVQPTRTVPVQPVGNVQPMRTVQPVQPMRTVQVVHTSITERIEKANSYDQILEIWQHLIQTHNSGHPDGHLTPYLVNKLMVAALALELPGLAVEIFQEAFGFAPPDRDLDPARVVLDILTDRDETVEEDATSYLKISQTRNFNEDIVQENLLLHNKNFDQKVQKNGGKIGKKSEKNNFVEKNNKILKPEDFFGKEKNSGRNDDDDDGADETDDFSGFDNSQNIPLEKLKLQNFFINVKIKPNNFVCTTAIKAYGRCKQVSTAVSLFAWFESQGLAADTYLLTALLYVCAKSSEQTHIKTAERIFWEEFPLRKIPYALATVNSFMYLYAKRNKPEEVLKVYELSKKLGLKCNVITYGTLIKALLRSGPGSGSGDRDGSGGQLQEKAFNILKNLPEVGIVPGVEVYNQFFEQYARTHDYRMMKRVLGLMARAKPKVQPDVMSYGYLTNCFAESRKPKSALLIFQQMRKRGIPPNAYTYMGVLKSLAHMRDGFAAYQVISEMPTVGVTPDKRHFSQAMFACITGNQPVLAERLFLGAAKVGGRPDAALCTLQLRALLQQGSWVQARDFFESMEAGVYLARPNDQTLNCLLQYQLLAEQYDNAKITLQKIFNLYNPNNSLEQDNQEDETDNNNNNNNRFSNSNIRRINKAPIKITSKKQQQQPSLEGTYAAVSPLLGAYSARMQRIAREDSAYLQRLELEMSAAAAATAKLANNDQDNSNSIIYSSSTSSYYNKDGTLKQPTVSGLKFLMKFSSELKQADRIYLQPEFYNEVLKALVMENHFEEASEFIQMRTSGEIKIRAEDMSKVKGVEDYARSLLKQ